MRSAADFERDINMGIFSLDMHEFATLDGTLTRLVTEIRPAVAVMLNEMGFQWRGHVVDFLRQGMIVRSPGFLRSRMYVEKTKVGPVESMSTRVGSLFARGKGGSVTFDGLAYAMGITHKTRNRTIALAARGGEKTARAKSSGKLMPGEDIPTPEQWDEVSLPQSRVQFMLRELAKKAGSKKIIIPKGYGMAPGLYRIKNRKGFLLSSGRPAPALQLMQHFARTPKSKRWMWLPLSMQDIIRRAPLAMMWQAAVERIIAKK
jgi:hypothetical protein